MPAAPRLSAFLLDTRSPVAYHRQCKVSAVCRRRDLYADYGDLDQSITGPYQARLQLEPCVRMGIRFQQTGQT
jgi:hypothetical protein